MAHELGLGIGLGLQQTHIPIVAVAVCDSHCIVVIQPLAAVLNKATINWVESIHGDTKSSKCRLEIVLLKTGEAEKQKAQAQAPCTVLMGVSRFLFVCDYCGGLYVVL